MATLRIQRRGFFPDVVAYDLGWDEQRALHAEVAAGTAPDTVMLLEHEPVYTAGRRTELADRPIDGTPVIDVDRGGRITWHGPGQLVGYPIVRLPARLDVVAHVRRLEEVLINTCAEVGFATGRIKGRSGVWFDADEYGPERKVAAIGVRVASGVTMHGFALNCDCDMTWYDRIVPCGIADAGVTSLSRESIARGGRSIGITDVIDVVEAQLHAVLGPTLTDHVVGADLRDSPYPIADPTTSLAPSETPRLAPAAT